MGRGGRVRLLTTMWPVFLCLTIGSQARAMSDCAPVIVDVLLGEPIPMDMMVDDLATVRIVYIGEVHTIRRHHGIQTKILNRLAERNMKLALGMEMFAANQQEILSRWQKGSESVEDLVRALGAGHWTNLPDYGPLLVSARKLGIPILGLNADDGLVRKVARQGIQSLSESEKNQIPDEVSTVDPRYDRLLRLRLKVHKAFQDRSLDNIVLAQAVRDEAMARALVKFLTSAEGKDRIVLVIAGAGHINYGFGIPSRVTRMLNDPFRIVLLSDSGELVLSEEEKKQAVPVEITHQDLSFIRKPIADYLHIMPLKSEPQESGVHPYRARVL